MNFGNNGHNIFNHLLYKIIFSVLYINESILTKNLQKKKNKFDSLIEILL